MKTKSYVIVTAIVVIALVGLGIFGYNKIKDAERNYDYSDTVAVKGIVNKTLKEDLAKDTPEKRAFTGEIANQAATQVTARIKAHLDSIAEAKKAEAEAKKPAGDYKPAAGPKPSSPGKKTREQELKDAMDGCLAATLAAMEKMLKENQTKTYQQMRQIADSIFSAKIAAAQPVPPPIIKNDSIPQNEKGDGQKRRGKNKKKEEYTPSDIRP